LRTSTASPWGTGRTVAFALVSALAVPVFVVAAITTKHLPPAGVVLVFAGFLAVVTNFRVNLGSLIFVSPDLMVVMAAIAAFPHSGTVLAAAIIGLSGGLDWKVLTRRDRPPWANGLVVAFNCSQFMLAAVAAALVDGAFPGRGEVWVLLAALTAAVAYAVVNVLLMQFVVVAGGLSSSQVWNDMRPALPNFFAFGLVGALVGQLYSVLGLFSLGLLVVPSLIARRTYRSTLALREARDSTIQVFLKALEVKDPYTARHTRRVAKFSCYIGEELGLKGSRLSDLRHAALMHDIGKLAVSSRLLNKPSRLTEGEYLEIRRHNEVCVEILSQIEFLRNTIPVAADHHAHFGATASADTTARSGYIVAVADAFDAMTSTRSYRRALPQQVAFAELQRGAGTQFHPDCVDALIRAIEQRGEEYGLGHEIDLVPFEIEPPYAGVGSAGLGDLVDGAAVGRQSTPRFPVRQPEPS